MKKIIHLLLFVVLFAGSASAQKKSSTSKIEELAELLYPKDSVRHYTDPYASFINKINVMKNTGLRVREKLHRNKPDTTTAKPGRRQPPYTKTYYVSTEGVHGYIRHFDKLLCTRSDGHIQCYYFSGSLGGQPYLVYTPLSVDSLAKAGAITSGWLNENAAHNFVIPVEDSPMAYFQYLVFKEYGNQFALHWHALYYKRNIMLVHPDEKVVSPVFGSKVESVMDSTLYNQARGQGILPTVIMDDDKCHIILYEQNHHYMTRMHYTISRCSPWDIQCTEQKVAQYKEVTY